MKLCKGRITTAKNIYREVSLGGRPNEELVQGSRGLAGFDNSQHVKMIVTITNTLTESRLLGYNLAIFQTKSRCHRWFAYSRSAPR
jgi:hypothetical protein